MDVWQRLKFSVTLNFLPEKNLPPATWSFDKILEYTVKLIIFIHHIIHNFENKGITRFELQEVE